MAGRGIHMDADRDGSTELGRIAQPPQVSGTRYDAEIPTTTSTRPAGKYAKTCGSEDRTPAAAVSAHELYNPRRE
jgi:hypothetical protein